MKTRKNRVFRYAEKRGVKPSVVRQLISEYGLAPTQSMKPPMFEAHQGRARRRPDDAREISDKAEHLLKSAINLHLVDDLFEKAGFQIKKHKANNV